MSPVVQLQAREGSFTDRHQFREDSCGDDLTVPISLSRRMAAELIGTFALVFAGTGAIVVNDVAGGSVTHVGISLTFALVVMAMIYALGDVSGAHINPAVTLGFVCARRFPFRELPAYMAAQVAGALLASALVRGLFPLHETLGATLPRGPVFQSFVLELLLTWLLMFVILHVSEGGKEKGIMAGAAIGGVIGFEALLAGPICGASMNPARSLAPAIVSGHLEHVWLYLAAPAIGAMLAMPACRCTRPGCCGARTEKAIA